MKSGCDASVSVYGVPSLNRNRETQQEIVSWTRFPCLQPDRSTQIPYQGHRLGAQHSHGLDYKWRKEMSGWKATMFILFSLLCCGSHSPWCLGSISSIGWCEVSGQVASHTSKRPDFQGARVTPSGLLPSDLTRRLQLRRDLGWWQSPLHGVIQCGMTLMSSFTLTITEQCWHWCGPHIEVPRRSPTVTCTVYYSYISFQEISIIT